MRKIYFTMLWDEVVLAAVTVLFLSTRHPMGVLVAVNGVLCHGSCALSLPFAARIRLWDVACNILMCTYANAHWCGQPTCVVLTSVAALCWRLNQRTTEGWRRSLIHAVGVQMVLLAALTHFTRACSSLKDHSESTTTGGSSSCSSW